MTPPTPTTTATDQTPTDVAPLRILIADDDHLVRTGITGILASSGDIRVVAEAFDGRETIRLAERHQLDAILLDIQMPVMDGLAALGELNARYPHLPVAMLTTFSDDHLIWQAIHNGARGFLLKSDDPFVLIASVRALVRDGAAFSPRVARWLAERERTNTRQTEQFGGASLTPRQRELLTHLGNGNSNAEIAHAMYLSEGTVKQYLSALFTELGLRNRVHAAVMAYKAGLIE